MHYAVIGGDVRFAHLVRMLKESGRNAAGFLLEQAGEEERSLEELSRYSCIISNWPMRWPLSGKEVSEAEIFRHIVPGSVLLLCGPGFPKERRWDLQYVNLWEDEELLCENAYLTAEAAIASVMRRKYMEMSSAKCLVVGYGRIGRALTGILLNLGAKVTVISSSKNKHRGIEEMGAQAASVADLSSALPGKKLIFSTPPAMVIDRDVLEHADEDVEIVDLASPPYGVDLDAAQALNLSAVREPGLPGRWCPMSAARAIYNSVLHWEGKEEDV